MSEGFERADRRGQQRVGFVEPALAEAKLTDSHTGMLLGEWVDRQIGSGSVETAAQWQWGDAENAIKTGVPKARESGAADLLALAALGVLVNFSTALMVHSKSSFE